MLLASLFVEGLEPACSSSRKDSSHDHDESSSSTSTGHHFLAFLQQNTGLGESFALTKQRFVERVVTCFLEEDSFHSNLRKCIQKTPEGEAGSPADNEGIRQDI